MAGARYGRLRLLDSRPDTSGFGRVQLGAFNKIAQVQAQPALAVQLQSVVDSLGGAGAAGSLLFQLRDLRFAELTGGGFTEEGWCVLRANLYAETGGRYAWLGTLDSSIYFRSMDVTRGLFRRCSKALVDFVQLHMATPAADSVLLDLESITRIDSIEKRRLPLYNTTQYRDGVYYTYASFAQQVPDILELMPRYNRKGSLKEVKIHMGEVDEVIKTTDYFAVVHQGRAWISTEFGYFALEKQGDDYFFAGLTRTSLKAGEAIANGLAFGLMGGLLSGPEIRHCRMRIDHVNGAFIPVWIGERYSILSP
ncbi:hypothetical protein GCM10028786_27150 [Flaviaesturariibacter terrae]